MFVISCVLEVRSQFPEVAFCCVVFGSSGDVPKRYARIDVQRPLQIMINDVREILTSIKIIQNETMGASGDLLEASCFQDREKFIP